MRAFSGVRLSDSVTLGRKIGVLMDRLNYRQLADHILECGQIFRCSKEFEMTVISSFEHMHNLSAISTVEAI